MDFHSLTRRELQSLCKKNNIPANITNLAMADALKALHTVEGIQEIVKKPLDCETEQSSIDFQETSPCVPRTGARTTRSTRKTAKDESETSTRTRRSSRKLVAGDGDQGQGTETPAATNGGRRRASALRKMEVQFEEVEEDPKMTGKEKKAIPQTPAVVGLKGETTGRRVYGTRRSARLAEKNIEDLSIKGKESLESVKSELFSEAFEENLAMNAEECSDEPTEIESTRVDLKVEAADGPENQNQFESGVDKESGESIEVMETSMKIEDGGDEGIMCDNNYGLAEALSGDIFDKSAERTYEAEEESGSNDSYIAKTQDSVENGDEFDANEGMISKDVAAQATEEEVIDNKNDAIHVDDETQEMSEEELDCEKDKESGPFDLPVTEEEENDMGLGDGTGDDLDASKDRNSNDLAADINNGVVENYGSDSDAPEAFIPESDEQDMALVNAPESIIVDVNTRSIYGRYGTCQESIALELNACSAYQDIIDSCLESNKNSVTDEDIKLENLVAEEEPSTDILEDDSGVFSDCHQNHDELPKRQHEQDSKIYDILNSEDLPVLTGDVAGEVPVSFVAADMIEVPSIFRETDLDENVRPPSLTPVKKQSSKTPVKKSVSKTPTTTKQQSNDNKENMDNSGTKLTFTKEKKKNKEIGQTNYKELSMRQLMKKFKELTIKKDQNIMGATSRPALQTLEENCRVAGDDHDQ